MTVCSLTPSRMGIMTLRRVWSNRSVTGLNLLGISLGRSEYVAGGLVFVFSWVIAGMATAIVKAARRNGTARTRGFMMCPRVLEWHRRQYTAHGRASMSPDMFREAGRRFDRSAGEEDSHD